MDPIRSAIVAIVDVGHDTVLMLRRRTDARSFPGHWCFPGGQVEAGESPAHAAVREAFEETGLRISGPRHEGTRLTADADHHRYAIDCSVTSRWRGRLRAFPTSEHVEARWVRTAVAPTLAPIGPVTRWLATRLAERGHGASPTGAPTP
jgi:8-oxo-dGTP diphosphatase